MKYAAPDLLSFAQQLLLSAGLSQDKAQAVADVLLEGDLLGHTTHGLALLGPYLAELAAGKMRKDGEPLVVSDHPAAVTWDGQRLPGPWLVLGAIELAASRAATQGTCTVVIRRSHHIACLAAYHQRVTDRGQMLLLHCSDPNAASIAPDPTTKRASPRSLMNGAQRWTARRMVGTNRGCKAMRRRAARASAAL